MDTPLSNSTSGVRPSVERLVPRSMAAAPSAEPAMAADTRLPAAAPRSDVGRAAASQISMPQRAGNQIDLFVDGSQAYPQMEALIDGAKERLDLEFFGVYPDAGGEEVADKLIAASKRGVQVNLLVDKVAGLSLHNKDLLARMEAGGVRVKPFENGYKLPLLHAFQITDHRKLLLVDGKVAMTGGMNLGISYEKYWHDLMVQFKGPTVADAYSRFTDNWKLSGGDALRPVTIDTRVQGADTAQVAVTTPKVHEIKASSIAAFDAAKHTIKINSPYYVDQDIVDALKRAAQRGVEVTALVPTVGDAPTIDYMNKMATNEMLTAGVKVYAFDTLNPDFPAHDHVTDYFNHDKVATVDGVWTTVGTANADTRSMTANQEINLVVDSPEFARTVEERVFERDLATRAKAAVMTDFPLSSWPKRFLLSHLRSFVFAF